MRDYLLSNRFCVLDGAIFIEVGYWYGKGDIIYALGIAMVGIGVVSTLQWFLLPHARN